MAQPSRPVAELVDFSGGLNSAEPPDTILAGQFPDARNLEYKRTKGLQRRRGSVENITSTIPFNASSSIVSLFKHTPGASDATAELWGIDNGASPVVARLAAGTSWSAALTHSDAISAAADARFYRGVSFNGKLFLFYNSAVDRLHCWDGTSVRRVGIATPSAPTAANTGAGAYAAVLRYYKVQFRRVDAFSIGYSPLSASVSFTPSGAGTAARVTRPSLPGDSETEWLVWGSLDDVTYYLISGAIATGTTTFDDSTAPISYVTVSPTYAGFPTQSDYFTQPISAKFGMVDVQQLLLGGSHESTALSSTIYYTPALNTTGYNVTDDERIPSTNRIDVEPQLGGGLTGLGGPILGTPVAFKASRMYLLNPTNDPTLPYTVQLLSDTVGCVAYQGIVLAEDENGAPALYFPARRGYYRYGSGGLEYLGKDIEDLWATVNFDATYGITADYHAEAGQIWIFLPVSGGSTPSVLIKFHVELGQRAANGTVRGGWTRDDGNVASSSAVCVFADTLGATMSTRKKPYVAKVASGGRVYKADHTTNRDDNDAVAYTAYLVTRPVEQGIGDEIGVQNVYLQGIADSSVTLDVGLRKDFASSDDVTQTAAFGTTRARVVSAGLELSECDVVQVRVADQSALNQHWQLDRIGLRVRQEAPKES